MTVLVHRLWLLEHIYNYPELTDKEAKKLARENGTSVEVVFTSFSPQQLSSSDQLSSRDRSVVIKSK